MHLNNHDKFKVFENLHKMFYIIYTHNNRTIASDRKALALTFKTTHETDVAELLLFYFFDLNE